MKVKEESEKAGLTLSIHKPKIMVSSPITSWQIDGEKIQTVTGFIFFSSKITVNGNCSHEIKNHLLLGRKAMTNIDNILKSRDITLLTKVHIVKVLVFSVVMYGCERWTVKKAEHQRIDAFELWCWRRLLRVPWRARRPNKSTLKEINSEYSLEVSHQFTSLPRFLSHHNKNLEWWTKGCRTTGKLQLSSALADRSFIRQTLSRHGSWLIPKESSSSFLSILLGSPPLLLYFLSSFDYALCKVGLVPTPSQWKGMQMDICSRPIDDCKLYNRLCCLYYLICLPNLLSLDVEYSWDFSGLLAPWYYLEKPLWLLCILWVPSAAVEKVFVVIFVAYLWALLGVSTIQFRDQFACFSARPPLVAHA